MTEDKPTCSPPFFIGMSSETEGRMLIVAFDGTSNEYDETNTNVVKLCRVLKMDDRNKQMVYYQPGIGTYTDPSIRGTLHKWAAKTLDQASAWYLGAHVMKGYEFLMDNWLPNDKISIFGFSRGAFTARALAAMLDSVGLLSRGNHEQVPFAYRMYETSSPLREAFKHTFCTSVKIELLGVWDTVGSVGLLFPKTLPLSSRDSVKAFRHAISLDESRSRFNVVLWKPKKEVTGRHEHDCLKGNPHPRVLEMWFAGGHCDIGGGSLKDNAPSSLSNISYRWMLREIQRLDCGILFDDFCLDSIAVPLDCVVRSPGPISQKQQNIRDNIPTLAHIDLVDSQAEWTLMLKPWTPSWWWLLQWPVWTGKKNSRWYWGTRQFPIDLEKREGTSQIHPTVLHHMEKYAPTPYQLNSSLPGHWRKHVSESD